MRGEVCGVCWICGTGRGCSCSRDTCPSSISRSPPPRLSFLDPLEYVKDKTSLIARVQAKLSPDGEGEGGGDDEEDEDEDDEDEAGGEKSKFKNLLSMDRRCNQERAAVVKDTKGKKGGKKGKKKKKK